MSLLSHLPHLSSQATDSLLSSTTGATTAAVVASINPPQTSEGLAAYLPALLAGVAGPLLAMAWRSILVIYQARRARKKALLEAEASEKLHDEDKTNDAAGRAAQLEADLIGAEIKAIDKLIDRVE